MEAATVVHDNQPTLTRFMGAEPDDVFQREILGNYAADAIPLCEDIQRALDDVRKDVGRGHFDDAQCDFRSAITACQALEDLITIRVARALRAIVPPAGDGAVSISQAIPEPVGDDV